MASDNLINMPSGIGGLTRFNQNPDSKFTLTPTHVIGLIVAIIMLRISLGYFF